MNFRSKRHALAYLMGVYLSDGCISTNQGSFILQVTDEVFRDEAAKAMGIVDAVFTLNDFQRKPRTHHVRGKVYPRSRTYTLWERKPWKVGWWLERTFPRGRDYLPLNCITTDDLAWDLVAGIMDGDGCICHAKTGYYHLSVSGLCEYLGDLEFLFAACDVLMHYHAGKMSHNINIKSFVKAGFYFRMPRKQALLDAYAVDSQKYRGNRGLKK